MPFKKLFRPIRAFVHSISVRNRIIILAAVPVIGFIANGATFHSSEHEVGVAFQNLKTSTRLVEDSQSFNMTIERLRSTARDFVAKPSQRLVEQFNREFGTAEHKLETIATTNHDVDAYVIGMLRTSLSNLKTKFDELVKCQMELGFDEDSGLRDKLRSAGNSIEAVINSNLEWVKEADARKLATALLVMRHHEAEYRLDSRELTRQLFDKGYKEFQGAIDRIELNTSANMIVSPTDMRNRLKQQVNAYADAFTKWVEVSGMIYPLGALIDIDSQRMLPAANQIISTAKRTGQAAEAALTASQSRTRLTIMLASIAVVALGLALNFYIGRGITVPMYELANAMKKLASGNTTSRIPATHAKDEIGDMARTVIVFRDAVIERENLSAAQLKTNAAQETRAAHIAAKISTFKASVETALARLHEAAQSLEASAEDLNNSADTVSTEAHQAEKSATAASENVTTAAGSVEELATSIGEILAQAKSSTDVAQRAVSEAQRTAGTMNDLGKAATRIGEVVGLIQAIAAQTNLLALNATIEAARAGESGKGFAVVAAEVKSLAGQTAKATDDIAGQVGAIQSAATDAAKAIKQVNGIIDNMAGIAVTVSGTVSQQSAAVSTISEGVNRASNDARLGAEAMSRIVATTAGARSTAAGVKDLADILASEAGQIETEVRQFLTDVQAA